MPTIPLSLLFFTSTKGHFGHKDIYLTTLADLNRQIPLDQFATKVAHIKVSPGDEKLGAEMMIDLSDMGFKVLETVAHWDRGQSHQLGYMADVIKVSKERCIHKNPHVLWLEDDATITPHQVSPEKLLAEMVWMIESHPDILTARLLRRCDHSTSSVLLQQPNYFWSPHVNFQPLCLRSSHFYLAAKFIEDNWDKVQNVQCEMLWRLVLAPFSRDELKHVVFMPDYAETIHLGVKEYPELKAQLNL
jgi:hypothetical protein